MGNTMGMYWMIISRFKRQTWRSIQQDSVPTSRPQRGGIHGVRMGEPEAMCHRFRPIPAIFWWKLGEINTHRCPKDGATVPIPQCPQNLPRDSFGRSALHWAALNGHVTVTEQLIVTWTGAVQAAWIPCWILTYWWAMTWSITSEGIPKCVDGREIDIWSTLLHFGFWTLGH